MSLPANPRRRLALRGVAALAAGALAGCGGGLSVGWGFGDFDGRDRQAPRVSLAAPAVVQAGQAFVLSAAAADDWSGIDDVVFYRLDNGAWTLLGSDGSEPYEWTTVAPADGRTALSVFARARDRAGNAGDSPTVTISVVP